LSSDPPPAGQELTQPASVSGSSAGDVLPAAAADGWLGDEPPAAPEEQGDELGASVAGADPSDSADGDGTQPLGTTRCPQRLGELQAPGSGLHVPLRVHLTRSDLAGDALCEVLAEVNEIWWVQAGICFDMEVVEHERPAAVGFDLWFERGAPFPNGTDANGVYVDPHQIYALDLPHLAPANAPSRSPAGRTASHELGHALGLPHQNCGEECDDLLMRSGTRGFHVVAGEPADMNEITRARHFAAQPQNVSISDHAPTAPCVLPMVR
jgi:hypothetical protein